MFKKLFGGKSDSGGSSQAFNGGGGGGGGGKGTDTVGAIQKLDETLELLMKRAELLEKKVGAETEKAKGYTKANNKRGKLTGGMRHEEKGWGEIKEGQLSRMALINVGSRISLRGGGGELSEEVLRS